MSVTVHAVVVHYCKSVLPVCYVECAEGRNSSENGNVTIWYDKISSLSETSRISDCTNEIWGDLKIG